MGRGFGSSFRGRPEVANPSLRARPSVVDPTRHISQRQAAHLRHHVMPRRGRADQDLGQKHEQDEFTEEFHSVGTNLS